MDISWERLIYSLKPDTSFFEKNMDSVLSKAAEGAERLSAMVEPIKSLLI